MKPDNEFEKLEAALSRAGKDIHYPQTPRLAARTRAELETTQRPSRFGLFAGAVGVALAVFVVLIGVLVMNGQQVASPPLSPGKAYTANLLSGDLSAVDLQRNALMGSIPVGANPWGIAVSQSGQRVYVAVDGGIAIVDTARAQRVDFVPTRALLPAGSAFSRAKVAISADERILLVAASTGEMKLIDMPTRGTLNEFSIEMVPYDIKLSPDGHFAYVLSETDGSVAIVDVRAGQMIERLTLGGHYRGYFMALSPDGRQLYVPRLARGELWIIDTTTNRAQSVRTEEKPYWKVDAARGAERGLAVSPDGARLYIATEDDFNGGVSVLDTQTFKETARANMGSGFFGAALSPDGSKLLLTIPETNHLTILDAVTLNLITSIEVGQSPFRVVVGQ